MLAGIGVAILFVVSAYILFLYMPTYAVRQLGLPFSQALLASTVGGCVLLVCSPILAAISDRVGRKPLLIAAALAFAVLTYPAFMLLAAQPRLWSLASVQSCFAVLMAAYSSPAIAVLAELFPTGVRSTAVALAYNLAVAVVGGTAQVFVTWLIAATGSALAPAFYVIGAALISASAAIAMRDRFREPLL